RSERLRGQPDSSAPGRLRPGDGRTQVKSHRILYSTIGLVLVLIIGAAYLLVNVMRINPLRGTYTVTVTLDRSGGLQPGNDVTLRGFRVGKVDSITLINGGSAIAATAEIDNRYDIAVDTVVAVQALSAAGEQYIDFRP